MSIPKTLSRPRLPAAGIGLALCLAIIVAVFVLRSLNQVHSAPLAVTPTIVHKSINYGLPVRLRIPTINVDVAIEDVGITSNGEMGTPKDPADVAWFNLGPHPGEVGNSVIDGHLDWYNGMPTAFENLNKLQLGDKLYVLDEKGTTTTFVVRGFGSYGQDQDATSVFRSVDGKAHLNLITCEGVWNQAEQSYSNRLVVFANKET